MYAASAGVPIDLGSEEDLARSSLVGTPQATHFRTSEKCSFALTLDVPLIFSCVQSKRVSKSLYLSIHKNQKVFSGVRQRIDLWARYDVR